LPPFCLQHSLEEVVIFRGIFHLKLAYNWRFHTASAALFGAQHSALAGEEQLEEHPESYLEEQTKKSNGIISSLFVPSKPFLGMRI
jgi:hypothetical protein